MEKQRRYRRLLNTNPADEPHIFGRVLETRLRAIIELPNNQCGFVKGAGTVDAILTVWIVMEKYREKRRESHAAFFDMEKAFDKVPHNVIWWALRKQMIPKVYIQWLKMSYHGSTSHVQAAAEQS
ncbi:unnamed protein product [Strongylus vulgaris]|uniref:Reverse transcriptase domain-containing protein n=1 Tax=Strongylus vulgaris TaxID=40348 RepID=A0A3P7JC19_STRVU|nr:unnamed protein product [Strongylus vulgaris]